MKQIKLNIGCGETKLKGFINIDSEKRVKPDLVHNITKKTLPFRTESVTMIQCIHNLEHIPLQFWPVVLSEFQRVLKKNGTLILAYPEFKICAEYFISNHRGMRNFWRDTLYGRQAYKGDFHVVPMDTKEVIQFLTRAGFDNFQYGPEVDESYNTFLTCVKGEIPPTKEDIVKKEIFR